jgi:recA bacterial DNA recombination protein
LTISAAGSTIQKGEQKANTPLGLSSPQFPKFPEEFMSSTVVSTSAHGRPFVFEDEDVAEVCTLPSGAEVAEARPPQRAVFSAGAYAGTHAGTHKDARLAGVTPASRLAVRPAPEMVSSGIVAMDALTGGLPRGCLTEICGPASSGRTTLLLAALAAATRRGECCAVVDASDALDPQSAVAAGVELSRLLWVRCGENSPEKSLEQLLRATDLLLESGGFGMIALDLGDLPPQAARRIPLTTWFRYRRAVEHTPTVLLAIERQSIAGSCSSLLIKLGLIKLGSQGHGIKKLADSQFTVPTHAQLLTELEITAELVRSRQERRPVCSAEITFASRTAWAG